MNVIDLKEYMKPGVRGHLVGIGGVSMSPLAEALVVAGLSITGSDIAESETVTRLRGMGIPIAIGHRAENIGDAQFIVRTAAARDDNPEIIAARAAGIPVFERAQAWGFIMQGYENALCIAGTHGKTTTTSMATHILLAADADPTVMIGGTLPKLHAGHRIGKGKVIVLESCEYYNSFHSFFPTVAVILNIENDHMDFFKDLDDIKKSFRTFAERVPEDRGCVVANFDDANTMDALAGISRKVVTFGVTDGADVQGIHIVHSGTRSEFDVSYHGENLGRIVLGIPGDHNVLDALAAVASALCLNIPFSAAAEGLSEFGGAVRRFERKGSYQGADIYDDYAHHPSELKALLDAVDQLDYKRVIMAFQPHTFTRTNEFFDEFAEQLRRPSRLFLADIYAAREKNTIGITSEDLARAIPGASYCKSFGEIIDRVRKMARPGDIVLTVGAGDIYKVGEAML